MMMCDCDDDDDELAFVDAIGDGRATGDVGDIDAIRGEGFLVRFFDMGTEVGEGTGAGVHVGAGLGEAVAETGESASGD